MMDITFETFQELVALLTEVGRYNDMAAYNIVSAAMNNNEWAIEVINRAKKEQLNNSKTV